MKKFIVIFVITILVALLGFSVFDNFRYKKAIKQLKMSVAMLNNEVYELKSETKDLEEKNKSLTSVNASAAKHPIDIEFDNCIAQNPTPAGTNKCTKNAEQQWVNVIEQNMSLLHQSLTPAQYQVLTEAQSKWEAYKKAQIILNNNTIGAKKGMAALNAQDKANAEISERRAKELSNLFSHTQK